MMVLGGFQKLGVGGTSDRTFDLDVERSDAPKAGTGKVGLNALLPAVVVLATAMWC